MEKCNFVFYTEELEADLSQHKKMSSEMEQALEEHKFLMYLQPMVDLHNYKIYSAEALVRWEHEEKGLLSPYAFLPVFENTNLMLKLDYYMWEEACKTIRDKAICDVRKSRIIRYRVSLVCCQAKG